MVKTKESARLARASRLKRARISAGFSGPKALEERFGFNPNTYKAHEAGRNGFTPEDAQAYAKAFNVTVGWLYFGEEAGGPVGGAAKSDAMLGNVLRLARIEAGRNQEEVGKAVGVTRQAVGQWESGETSPGLEKLRPLCAYLGISVNSALEGRLEYLDLNDISAAQQTSRVVEFGRGPDALPREGPRDVPVYGFAVGGTGGEFHMNGDPSDYAPRPPSLARTRRAYAIYCFNDSMWPRFAPGDRLYVDPDRPPNIGDDVLIELAPEAGAKNGDAFIKRLVRRTAAEIICEQFNPAGEVRFDRARVLRLHRIVPTNELFGM